MLEELESTANATEPEERPDDDFDGHYREQLPALLSWARGQVPKSLRGAVPPEDLVQEVWYRAVRSRPDFDPRKASFRCWIFGIARYVLLDTLRRAARRNRFEAGGFPPDVAPDAIPQHITTASQQAARDESLRSFADWIHSELSPEDRRLLLMRGFEARDWKELVREFGIKLDSLQRRWSRLRSRIESFPGFSALALEP